MEKVVKVTEESLATPDPQTKPVPTLTSKKSDVSKPLLKIFQPKNMARKSLHMNILISIIVIITGVATGWLLSGGIKAKEGVTSAPTGDAVGDSVMGADNEVGIADEETFKDEAEGIMTEGGIDGEGTHHLDRSDLGPGKDVYLTSTAINLQNFVGKKVKVWGQTVAGQKAAWLMDVGRVKVLE